MDASEKDYEAFKSYVTLWASENSIKTNKLQVLLVVNGLFVSALQLNGGFVASNWPIFAAGGIFSLIWVFSIGRTSLFQKAWQLKANEIAGKTEYRGDPRFQILDTTEAERRAPWVLRIMGILPSKYYLLGAPVGFALLWFGLLVYLCCVSADAPSLPKA